MKSGKRIGLKYCGGCNPSYQRREYVERIREAAGSRIEWMSIEQGGFDTILVVSGCDKQCALMAEYKEAEWRVVSIKDHRKEPGEILSILLEEGET